MPDWSESCQSGTRMKINSDAGTILVPKKGDPVRYRNAPVADWDDWCRNTDAGGIGLDADALLRSLYRVIKRVFRIDPNCRVIFCEGSKSVCINTPSKSFENHHRTHKKYCFDISDLQIVFILWHYSFNANNMFYRYMYPSLASVYCSQIHSRWLGGDKVYSGIGLS